jgi:hypothetical protein
MVEAHRARCQGLNSTQELRADRWFPLSPQAICNKNVEEYVSVTGSFRGITFSPGLRPTKWHDPARPCFRCAADPMGS